MPIYLDPSLPTALYPLAWLVGSWNGEGAVQLSGAGAGDPGAEATGTEDSDAGDPGRRIEQHLVCSPREDDTLAWVMRTEVVDAPAPLPPTSVFASGDTDAHADTEPRAERSLLLREKGFWRVGDPLPGQDLQAAQNASPGDPAGVISYAVELVLGEGEEQRTWSGEVRGPRIQLALAATPGTLAPDASAPSAPAPDAPAPTASAQTRMFGLVGGRLMWLWEHATDPARPTERSPYLSVEMDRG